MLNDRVGSRVKGRDGFDRGVRYAAGVQRPNHRRESLVTIQHLGGVLGAVWLLAVLGGCQPKVAVEAPKEPITINLNVKIEHEIRVKVDKELDQLFEEEEGLF